MKSHLNKIWLDIVQIGPLEAILQIPQSVNGEHSFAGALI